MNSVILSESIANQLFGDTDPTGEILNVDHRLELEVTGVYRDFPGNSSFHPSMIGSFHTLGWASSRLYWGNCSFTTFIKLHPLSNIDKVEKAMNQIYANDVEEEERWFMHYLQPVSDMHLRSTSLSNDNLHSIGDYRHIRLLSILAIAILLIAGFNYINLTTAKIHKRMKEVGISKTLGANQFTVISRFLVETSLLVLISILIAVFVIQFSQSFLFEIAGYEWTILNVNSVQFWLSMLGFWLILTLLAGLYPALISAQFTPAQIVKSSVGSPNKKGLLRNTLVSVQFTICIALIIMALFIQKQMNFISQQTVGFAPDKTIAITMAGAKDADEVNSFKNAISQFTEVESQCILQAYPGIDASGYSMKPTPQSDRSTFVSANRAKGDFIQTLNLELLAGRSLPEKMPEDTTIQVVMNEAGVAFSWVTT